MNLEHALDLIEPGTEPYCFQVAQVAQVAQSMMARDSGAPPVPPKNIDERVQTQRWDRADLLNALWVACRGLDITPAEVTEGLASGCDQRRYPGRICSVIGPTPGDGSGQAPRPLHRAGHLQALRSDLAVVLRRDAGLSLVLEPGSR